MELALAGAEVERSTLLPARDHHSRARVAGKVVLGSRSTLREKSRKRESESHRKSDRKKSLHLSFLLLSYWIELKRCPFPIMEETLAKETVLERPIF